jgi:hypothetical protein
MLHHHADAVYAFFIAIEEGWITIVPDISPEEAFCGDVEYTASNGWKITIFVDCYDWDYVEKILDAQGESLVDNSCYHPSPDTLIKRWGWR